MRHSSSHRRDVPDTSSILPVRPDQLAELFAKPDGKVYLLYGHDVAFALSLRMAARAMTHGSSIAVVDGGNRFNVHLLARFARERRIDPDAFLRRIYVSRGFTCYQMEQAIINRLPAFLRSIDSRTALVFGLLDTFYDEQAPLREVQQILRRLLGALAEMKAQGTSVLLVSTERTVEPKERNALFTVLKGGMDRVVRLQEDEGTLQLVEERQTRRGLKMEDGRLTMGNGV
jgi:hypothetical protein